MLDSSRKRAEVYIIPFFITAIMLFVIFYKVGIYPFGERSLLIWDLRWQYIQFFSWFKQVLEAVIFFIRLMRVWETT